MSTEVLLSTSASSSSKREGEAWREQNLSGGYFSGRCGGLFSVIEVKILQGSHVNIEGMTVSTENFYYIQEKETIELNFPKSVEMFGFRKT